MFEITSETIKIKTPALPPTVDFIEKEFKKMNLDVVRWAIVDVLDNELILSVAFKI